MKQVPHVIVSPVMKTSNPEVSRECSVFLGRAQISTLQEGVIQKINGHDALPFLPPDKLKDLTSRVFNGDSGAQEAKVRFDEPPEIKGVETPPSTTPTKNGSPEIKLKITKTYMNGKPLFESSICGEAGEEPAKEEEEEEVVDDEGKKSKRGRKRKNIKSEPAEDKQSCEEPVQSDSLGPSDLKECSDLDSATVKEDEESLFKFSIGDLVWSKVSGYPWWPCMVTSDPVLQSHTKMKGQRKGARQYHVQFFGNAPERAWIFEKSITHFNGEHEYDQRCQESAKQTPNKAEKLKLLKPISGKIRVQWDIGIQQAKEAITMTSEDRKEKYIFVYVKDRPHLNPKVAAEAGIPLELIQDTDNVNEKSESQSNEDGIPSKRRRVSKASNATSRVSDPSDSKSSSQISDSLESRSSMAFPNTKRKSGASTPKSRKGAAVTQFLVFCQKHREEVVNEHPDASAEEIEELLESQWDLLSDKQKARYNTKFAIVTSPKHEDSGSPVKNSQGAKQNLQELPQRNSRSRSKLHGNKGNHIKMGHKRAEEEDDDDDDDVKEAPRKRLRVRHQKQKETCIEKPQKACRSRDPASAKRQTGLHSLSDACKPLKKRNRSSGPSLAALGITKRCLVSLTETEVASRSKGCSA